MTTLWTTGLAALSDDAALIALGRGAMLGLAAASPPGPVNLEITRRTVRGGFGAGAAVGLGAVTIDVLYAVLLVLGVLTLLNEIGPLRLAVTAIGVLLLAYLGVGALRGFAKHVRQAREAPAEAVAVPTGDQLEYEPAPDAAAVAKPTPWGGYVTGLLLCSTSPVQAAFWLVGVPAVLPDAAVEGGLFNASALMLCAGVFGATLAWVVGFSGLVAFVTGGAWVRRWLGPTMDLVAGVLLLALSAWAAVSLVRSL